MSFCIKAEPLPSEDLYMITEGVIIEGILLERGFKWNGASIPWFLWPILGSPFEPDLMAPSAVHDKEYRHPGKYGSRLEADRRLLKLLLANTVNRLKAKVVYRGVRIGGIWTWQMNSRLN